MCLRHYDDAFPVSKRWLIANWLEFSTALAFLITAMGVSFVYVWPRWQPNRTFSVIAALYIVGCSAITIYKDITGPQFGTVTQYLFIVLLLIVALIVSSNYRPHSALR